VTFEKHFDCDTEKVLRDIADRKKTIEGVVITGGEPTIYPELIDFIARIKEMGLLVKLDTNGSNPRLIFELLRERLLDYIAMDVKTSLGRYPLVTDAEGIDDAISESARWIVLSTIPYEFRTTCVPGIVDEKDFAEIGALVRGAKKYCLQQFSPAVTLDSAFHDLKPYTKAEICRFRDILKGYVETVETRGF
jgi:pyruvate formate lyase activating enzyme